MRSAHLAFLGLVLFSLATPQAAATKTLAYGPHTYPFNGIYRASEQTAAFAMPDPGGGAPVACYYSSLSGGPAGAIIIRVYDQANDLVFLDAVVGVGLTGVHQPVGFAGIIPGTWRITVDADGYIPSTSVTVKIYAASSISLC
ncbi:MAG: hypothetical protein ACYDCK_02935 [Thermoplasmatota archaeon]